MRQASMAGSTVKGRVRSLPPHSPHEMPAFDMAFGCVPGSFRRASMEDSPAARRRVARSACALQPLCPSWKCHPEHPLDSLHFKLHVLLQAMCDTDIAHGANQRQPPDPPRKRAGPNLYLPMLPPRHARS